MAVDSHEATGRAASAAWTACKTGTGSNRRQSGDGVGSGVNLSQSQGTVLRVFSPVHASARTRRSGQSVFASSGAVHLVDEVRQSIVS